MLYTPNPLGTWASAVCCAPSGLELGPARYVARQVASCGLVCRVHGEYACGRPARSVPHGFLFFLHRADVAEKHDPVHRRDQPRAPSPPALVPRAVSVAAAVRGLCDGAARAARGGECGGDDSAGGGAVGDASLLRHICAKVIPYQIK